MELFIAKIAVDLKSQLSVRTQTLLRTSTGVMKFGPQLVCLICQIVAAGPLSLFVHLFLLLVQLG